MSKFWDFLFHQHSFNPDKWELLITYDIHPVNEFGRLEDRVSGNLFIYTNTCLKCGDLVRRRVDSRG
jgi:hypothetical protein